MRLLSGRRNAARNTNPTWEDIRPDWDADGTAARYVHIPEIDRWRAVPFDMPPSPDRASVLERVREHIRSLESAIDEGTGSVLDRLIEAWVASWVATVEADYTDHCAVINVHRGQAAQWLTESTHTARHESEELEHVRAAYLACRARLAGEQPGSGRPTSRQPEIKGELS